jgi:hypothetical protein
VKIKTRYSELGKGYFITNPWAGGRNLDLVGLQCVIAQVMVAVRGYWEECMRSHPCTMTSHLVKNKEK